MQTQPTDDRGPGVVRVLFASLISILVAMLLANVALAQDSPTDVADPEPECVDGTTQFLTVEGLGWAEVALRVRGLVLVDYEAIADAEAEVVSDSADLIEIRFATDDEEATLRIEHANGELITDVERRSVLSAGSEAEAGLSSGEALPPESDTDGRESDSDADDGTTTDDSDKTEAERNSTTSADEPQPWLQVSGDSSTEATGQLIQAGLDATAYRQNG